jgi:flagellar biosynthetic protein FliR
MNLSEGQILVWIASFIWPLLRISAMFVSVPLFSLQSVPARTRLILALTVTIVIVPVLPAYQTVEMFSYAGFMVALAQVLIGLTTGFILQLAFSALLFAGQGVALSMGLGFASMVDPQNGQQVPVIAQFYVMVCTLVFLSLDGHLVLIKMLLDSFTSLPIGLDSLSKTDLWEILMFSSRIFSGGLLLTMPIIVSLLLANIFLAVATRAAPQLNIFSVGFPVTLMLGMVLVWITLPSVTEQFAGILTETYGFIEKLLRL